MHGSGNCARSNPFSLQRSNATLQLRSDDALADTPAPTKQPADEPGKRNHLSCAPVLHRGDRVSDRRICVAVGPRGHVSATVAQMRETDTEPRTTRTHHAGIA